MAELARHVLTEQAVDEAGERHQRQGPADGAARHFQGDGEKDDGHGQLQPAAEEAVLVGKRIGV